MGKRKKEVGLFSSFIIQKKEAKVTAEGVIQDRAMKLLVVLSLVTQVHMKTPLYLQILLIE